MILSACIIIKDDGELNNLKRCIDSFIDYVDEVVVTANGDSVKEIEKYCKTEPKIKYFYHKWTKDFSEQRNFCASKIRKDSNFYTWIDTDDILVGASYLRDIAIKAKKSNLDAVFFEYWYSCSFKGEPSEDTINKVELTQMRERILKPGSVVWKKRLHETPVPEENIDYKFTQIKHTNEYPIAWLHLGVINGIPVGVSGEERMARNRELLELELDDERKTKKGADPRTLLYLMKIYAESNNTDLLNGCIQMGEEYLTKSGWDAERAICCSLIGKALGKQGLEEQAKDFLFKSIGEYPYDPIMYLYLSRTCFNLGQYHEMKHWLEIALRLEMVDTNITNLLELKSLSTELLMEYYFKGARDVRKAYKSMKLLYKEIPSKENKEKLEYLKEMNDLDLASESAHKLMIYYEGINDSKGVVKVVESMPEDMQKLPFAWYMYNKHKVPRVWKDDEICYYASFGQQHFETWGPANIAQGIGGSETAVIRLSKEWASSGYKVIVYCDCGSQEGMHDGVLYLPYYKFNPRDNFNIFINWRSNHLAGRIKAKKFLIDLHDLFNNEMIKDHQRYDKLMVKSEYHGELADIPKGKVEVISNGI